VCCLCCRDTTTTEPFRIPLAGKLSVCAFDKTGTLTSDELRFEGVAPGGAAADDEAAAEAAAAAEPQVDAAAMPPGAALCLGACHALVLVEGALAGDPLERAALSGLGWSYGGNDVVSIRRAPGAAAASPALPPSVRILRRLHFTPELRRMVVVAAPSGREAEEGWVLAKGAPEAVLPLCEPSSLPPGCARVYARLAARGARVLALAWRPLSREELAPPAGWRAAPRAQLEARLRFAGFALFSCPIRACSAPSLAALRRARHATIMLTGDAPLTACHVARETRIVNRALLLLQPAALSAADADAAAAAPQRFEWASPDGTVLESFDAARLPALGATHDLCVSGDGLAYASAAGALGALVRHTQVYARCAPEQKEAVLKALRAAGLDALMCGDGTNDVGALKAAAVGVALMAPQVGAASADAAPLGARGGSSRRAAAPPPPASLDDDSGGRLAPLVRLGDASMAAPFTARHPSVASCVQVVRQGRSALVTTIQMFKILGLNCLVTAFALSVQYLEGVKLGDTQATTAGLASAAMFMCLALGKPASRLARERPHDSVFSAYALASVAVQCACHLALLWRAVALAQALEAADPVAAAAAAARHPDDDAAPGLVNSAAFLASSALQLTTFAVNYVGAHANAMRCARCGCACGFEQAQVLCSFLTFARPLARCAFARRAVQHAAVAQQAHGGRPAAVLRRAGARGVRRGAVARDSARARAAAAAAAQPAAHRRGGGCGRVRAGGAQPARCAARAPARRRAAPVAGRVMHFSGVRCPPAGLLRALPPAFTQVCAPALDWCGCTAHLHACCSCCAPAPLARATGGLFFSPAAFTLASGAASAAQPLRVRCASRGSGISRTL
jgi:cation-transporting ATPase 13A1